MEILTLELKNTVIELEKKKKQGLNSRLDQPKGISMGLNRGYLRLQKRTITTTTTKKEL